MSSAGPPVMPPSRPLTTISRLWVAVRHFRSVQDFYLAPNIDPDDVRSRSKPPSWIVRTFRLQVTGSDQGHRKDQEKKSRTQRSLSRHGTIRAATAKTP
jgi:hypothetical protein